MTIEGTSAPPDAPPARPDRRSGRPQLLRHLGMWWIGLLALAVIAGELVVHVGNGYVLAHVDQPIDAHLWPEHRTLRPQALAITWLGSQQIAIAGAVVLFLALLLTRRRLAGAAIVTYIGANTVTGIAKLIVLRPGPYMRAATGLRDSAFPSGHSTASAALFLGAAMLLTSGTRRGWIRAAAIIAGIVIAAGVAFSRLILDVHWSTDVCAGFLVGATWAIVVERAWRAGSAASSTG